MLNYTKTSKKNIKYYSRDYWNSQFPHFAPFTDHSQQRNKNHITPKSPRFKPLKVGFRLAFNSTIQPQIIKKFSTPAHTVNHE